MSAWVLSVSPTRVPVEGLIRLPGMICAGQPGRLERFTLGLQTPESQNADNSLLSINRVEWTEERLRLWFADVADLIDRKLAGPEHATLDDADIDFHRREYE